MGLTYWDYSVIVLYFAVMLGVGWYFSKKDKNAAEYLLGGRNMSAFLVAFSMLMTLFSTYSLVMSPGEIYNHGLDWGIVGILTPFLAIFSILIFSKFIFKIKAFTPFEYLSYRYDRYSRLLAAFGSSYGQVMYGGMVLLTTSKIFEAAAGWPCWITILLVGGISVAYTGAGGLKAVVWTDTIQFFVMLFGMLVLVGTLCRLVPGGAWGAVSYAFEHGHGLSRFNEKEFYSVWPYVRLTFWALIISRLLGAIGAGLQPMTVQRLLSTGTVKKAVKAQFTSACLALVTILLLDFIGLGIYSYYSQCPDPAVTTGDLALFRFVGTKLPFLVPGLFVAAALAAAMSTLSSIFNGEAAVWLREYYLPFFNKGADDAKQLSFSKKATLFIGALCIGFALLQWLSSLWMKQTMVEVGMVFGFFTSSVGYNAYLFAILSRKASSLAFWSMQAIGYGFKDGLLLWYTLSKRGEIQFNETGNVGLAGPIGFYWVWIPLLVVALLWCVGEIKRNNRKWRNIWRVVSLIPFGFAMGTTLWYIFSNCSGDATQPHALSFTWAAIPGFLMNLILMFGWHFFGPEVPREKYAGLIWGYSDEKIAGQEEEVK